MPLLDPESPCIGYCSTVFGDDICRGCNRYFEEVLDWKNYSNDEKLARTQRIALYLCQAVQHYLQINNPVLLKAQLARKQIVLPSLGGDEACAFALLQQGAEHIRNLNAYGICPTKASAHLSAVQILYAIDAKRRDLAQAHYRPIF